MSTLYTREHEVRVLRDAIALYVRHEAVALSMRDDATFAYWRAKRNTCEAQLSALLR
jgi:hypothetical protein